MFVQDPTKGVMVLMQFYLSKLGKWELCRDLWISIIPLIAQEVLLGPKETFRKQYQLLLDLLRMLSTSYISGPMGLLLMIGDEKVWWSTTFFIKYYPFLFYVKQTQYSCINFTIFWFPACIWWPEFCFKKE